jgi:uncharacterized protein YjbJ (UPF0337 family)
MEEVMDWNRVAGSWKQLEGKVKTKWGLLTDDDLMTIKGSRELLVGKIQERYGIAKDEARKQIDEYFASQGYWQITVRDKSRYMKGASASVGAPFLHMGRKRILQTELQTNHAAQDGIRDHRATGLRGEKPLLQTVLQQRRC